MPSKKLFGVPLDRQSLGEMIRFSIVGVLVTAIHYAVYWLLQLVIDVNNGSRGCLCRLHTRQLHPRPLRLQAFVTST